MAATSVISDEREARQIEAKLEAQRSIVVEALAVVAQAEAERDDLLVNRELGQRVPDREIERLESRIAQSRQTIRTTERVIVGLQDRLAAWRDDDIRRRHDVGLARMQEISQAAPSLEAQFCETATLLVTIAGELRRAQHDFDQASHETTPYRTVHQLGGVGARRPASPFAVPSRFYDEVPREAEPGSRTDWEQFLYYERRNRGIT